MIPNIYVINKNVNLMLQASQSISLARYLLSVRMYLYFVKM